MIDEVRIKRFAAWARGELVASTMRQLAKVGVTRNSVTSDRVGTTPRDGFGGAISQVESLQAEACSRGYDHLVRRVSYVWFMRIVAIRYMEVNDLLPHHIRMFSSRDGSSIPESISHAMDMPFESLNQQHVAHCVQTGEDSELMELMLVAQCNELAKSIPFLFEPAGSSYDSLVPVDLLREGGLLRKMVDECAEEDWRSGVEVFGFLFEGYAEGRKNQVREKTKRSYLIESDDMAVMNQLCLVGWLGRFLVENSLGRLLSESGIDLASSGKLRYMLHGLSKNKRSISLEQLSIADFACGSGMLLAYAFDLLMEAYTTLGFSMRDAVQLILQRNLCGIDVDERAVLYAKFVLCMKACEYDKRFLKRGVAPRIALLESIAFSDEELKLCTQLASNDDLLQSFRHLNECGSLFVVDENDEATVRDMAAFIDALNQDGESIERLSRKVQHVLEIIVLLRKQHDVVLCDPPRSDAKRINRWYAKWIVKHYPNDRHFLPACFMDRALCALKSDGYAAVHSSSPLLFSNNASTFRQELLEKASIVCAIDTTDNLGSRWSSEACWILSREQESATARFVCLDQHPNDKEEALIKAASSFECCYVYDRETEFFKEIPGCPFAYKISPVIGRVFSYAPTVSRYARTYIGIGTGNSSRFLRQWFEMSLFDKGWEYHPITNGGFFRKWYGNRGLILRWANDGEELKRSFSATNLNLDSHFRPGIVWGAGLNFRLLDSNDFMVGSTGIMLSEPVYLNYLLGMLNSSSFDLLYKAINTGVNVTGGEISKTPAVFDANRKDIVDALVTQCVDIARMDYDASELSVEFKRNPLC